MHSCLEKKKSSIQIKTSLWHLTGGIIRQKYVIKKQIRGIFKQRKFNKENREINKKHSPKFSPTNSIKSHEISKGSKKNFFLANKSFRPLACEYAPFTSSSSSSVRLMFVFEKWERYLCLLSKPWFSQENAIWKSNYPLENIKPIQYLKSMADVTKKSRRKHRKSFFINTFRIKPTPRSYVETHLYTFYGIFLTLLLCL